ncbi:UPF0182 family protein [Streptomyces sp. RB6PN25]|uniref:UPF0182 protein NGB36_06565 n=1 Tax=Streptomyces humicola TaxID=2953240 RepID=A0ABT1PRG6_9ACTN|nr:UPF0182 family protein [Streptomyces humicola]MCQ4080268.1 UPF0182 family protein [Streptomyces humicola]
MPERGAGPSRPRTGAVRPSRHARTLFLTLAVLVMAAMAFVMFSGFWTDWLWYRSVHYSSVFSITVTARLGLFFVFGLVMAVTVGLNIHLAHRLRPQLGAMSVEQQSLDRYRLGIAPYRGWVLLTVSLLVGLVTGASASGEWSTWLSYVNAVPFGTKDPQFHKDVSFYVFDLPWYRFLLGFGFAAVVLSLIAAAVVHYLYGGLRISAPGTRATAAATGHLSVLLGIFVSLKAVAYWLDRYGLAVKSSSFKAATGWTGLRYVDANAYLPAKTILFCIAIICALLFFATLWRRTWSLPVIGFGLMVLSAILIGGLYPLIVQKFQVQPDEAAKEGPYIQRNINATRAAYGIDGTKATDYPGTSGSTPNSTLRADANTTASIRLLDPNVVSPTFQQLQQMRSYYSFNSPLAVDRYPAGGGQQGTQNTQDTVVGLRELNIKGIPDSNWINDHFKYTHGYGLVAANGTAVTDTGAPSFTESNLPPQGQLGSYQPRIYYGEQTTQWSIVGGPTKEIDYSTDNGEKSYTYTGRSGVSLANPVTRAAYAVQMDEPQLMYSQAIGKGSRLLYNRTPKERVESVAPWLTIDGDPYPAVVNGRIVWIVDGYTTTDSYPYSSRTTLGDTTADSLTGGGRSVLAQQDEVNYIRNSVKATVDAYDGTVKLYQWDTGDPVLKTWMKAYPGTVLPRSAISPQLMQHLRYPQDLFKVQRQMLTRYHVTDASTFYSGSEVWQVPDDPSKRDGAAVPPYYQSLKMPGQSAQAFSLTTTFTPSGRDNLGAYMAVDADATSPDYGTIRLLQLPTSSTVSGPKQVQSKFNSDPAVANQVNIWQKGDSEVEYGNLLTVPLDGGLLYVEPVYVRGAGTNYPLLKKVLVTYGDSTAFDDTLSQALDDVFAAPTSEPTGRQQPPPGTGGSQSADPTVKQALADAQAAFDAGQQALKRGDWAAYGTAQAELQAALKRAEDASTGRRS